MDKENLTLGNEVIEAKNLIRQDQFNELKNLIIELSLSAKDVYTLEEAAIVTGFKKSTLYQLTHKKKIPHYKPNNGAIYFDRVELMDWLRQNKVEVKQ